MKSACALAWEKIESWERNILEDMGNGESSSKEKKRGIKMTFFPKNIPETYYSGSYMAKNCGGSTFWKKLGGGGS